MRDNTVRAKIKRGEPVYGTMITEFEHPALPVILADAGFDFFSMIQIESKRAVEHLDDLLSVPGLDVALVGPWDLALSLGVAPGDALIDEMTQRVVEAARQHKVASGIHLGDPEAIRRWRMRGMTLLSCLTDLEILRNSAQALAKALHA